MRALKEAELLANWERGLNQSPIQRALALLAVAYPETSLEALASLDLGQRDARLLTLREQMFGPSLSGLVACPACGERLELTFTVEDIRVMSDVPPDTTLTLSHHNYEVRFRLPNSLDLIAAANSPDVIAARRLLLRRCILSLQTEMTEMPVEPLPADLEAAIVEKMAQADPQADVQLALTCSACEHQWLALFDIALFFWNELNAWAYRLLYEIHRLATAYSWLEADILALSPWRRQFYLQQVGE